MMFNPFGDVEDEEEDEDDDYEEEEPVLMLRCAMMAQRKPCCYQGKCVELDQATLQMKVCKHFIIVDATEEDVKDLEIAEEN